MFRKILAAVSGIILLFCLVVFLMPSEFKISRSEKIKAAPFVVFANVNNFHSWADWSPWAKLDSSMSVAFEGAEMGQGAIYKWKGNDQVGEGRMTITESNSNEKVVINLEFLKPFQATNLTEFNFSLDGDLVFVEWSMSGHRSFIEKVFNIFFNLDKIVGADFEKGLASLKNISESR